MRNGVFVASLLVGCAVAQAQDKLVLDGSTTVGPIAKAFAAGGPRVGYDGFFL